MTVSLGNGVDIGNLVTAETNPLTGRIEVSAGSVPFRLLRMSLSTMLQTVGAVGDICFLSDYPTAPAFAWDGTNNRWGLTAPWAVVASSTVYTRNSANVADDTTDALMASFTLPGGVMGPHSKANIRYYFTSGAGTTVSKILFVKWAGTGLPGTNISAGQTGRQSSINIYNDGSLISQKLINADNETATATDSMYTLAGNTSNNITLDVYGRFGAQVAGESLSLQHFQLVLWP